jgi:hypothetical protein
MKKSIIPWHVFREAFEGQDPEVLERWLGRWGFTNDGVVLIGMDICSGSQPLSFDPRESGPDALALNRGASLQDLVQILTRDPSLLIEQLARLWSYNKEL